MNHYCKLSRSLAVFFLMVLSMTLQSQNALNFDGTNDYVQTSFDGVLGSADRTFEAWINVNSGSSANKAIMDYGVNSAGSRNTFSVGGNYQLSFISGGTNANISSGSNAITPGQWTHVAFVLNSGTGYLYVNGVQVGTGSLSSVNTPSGNTDLRIGQRVPGGSIPFPGAIDEVRVWSTARTTSEISSNMNSEFCTPDSNLVAYYKFNHGVAGGTNSGVTSAYDATGNGNNGTLTNLALSGSTSNWVTGYGLSTGTLSTSINATSCGSSYTSPSGNYTWTQPGTYTDTMQSVMACDSVLTIALSFSSNSSASISVSACEAYTSPSGGYTWTSSGTYTDTIANASGCDSILTIALTINNSTGALTVEACESYTTPSGNHTYTFSGSYHDTIPNAVGCDSIIAIDLTIHQPTSSFISESACQSYTSPSGNYVWTESGTYNDTVTNVHGCDSMMIIDLSVQSVDTSVQVIGNTISCAALGATFQWLDCDNNYAPLNGKTGPSFTPTTTGNYAVAVTQNGCTDTSRCVNINIVGVENEASGMQISVYPNPTTGIVMVDLGGQHEELRIRVTNTDGRVVTYMEGATSDRVQLDMGQATGLYTIHLYTKDGYRAFRVMKVD